MAEIQGFTLRKLAEKVGATQSALSKIETEKSHPSGKWLKALVDALRFDMED